MSGYETFVLAFAAFIFILIAGAYIAIPRRVAAARRGDFPPGFVDRFVLEVTGDKHVALTVIDVEGKATRHVLHALHAHQLSTHLLVASGKARDPRTDAERPRVVA